MEFGFTFAALLQTAATLYLYTQMRHARLRKAQMYQTLKVWIETGNTAEVGQ